MKANHKEAMKLALDYIVATNKSSEFWLVPGSNLNKTVTALREALAEQPAQQEPVAWKNAAIRLGEELSSVGPDGYYDMTAEQWLDWAMDQRPQGKNSLPAQQEPVAWIDEYGNAFPLAAKQYSVVGKHWKPLYTSPPAQRTWVGLTDEEIQTEWVLTPQNDKAEGIWFGRRIEAKLKERNQ